jgi:subtilisin family serine protease
MGSGGDRTRTASGRILRPRLLVTAALAALIVAATTGGQTPARAMSFTAARFNSGPHTSVSRGSVSGHEGGIVGRGDSGKAVSTNPCKSGRLSAERCGSSKVVVNNGGDRPGGRDGNPRRPHGPILTHQLHVPSDPIATVNAPIVVTQPTAAATGAQPQGPGPQAVRRSGTGVPPINERRYMRDEVVVELAATATNAQTEALARRFRLARLQSVASGLTGTTLMRWRITDRRSVPVVVRALETDATVLWAQPNYLFALQDGTGTPAAPAEGDPGQYILGKMHLPQAHELAKGNKVLVAVIDSGIDVTHPDLAGDIAGTFDAIGSGLKTHPHGTAIAGAIAAHGRLMGAAPAAQILAVRAFTGDDSPDGGTSFAIMSGVEWAVAHGARVINMSFAGPQDPGIARRLAAAHDKGVVLVAAAGNKGAKSPPLYPAADPNVIAVTSTDANDQLPAFANRGRYVAVAAPGVDLMLLAPNGALQFSSGTSYSAAYVTGTAALMLERKPDLGPDTLRQALTGTAHRLAATGTADEQPGAGLVDAYRAVLSLVPAPAVDAANVLPAAARR